MSPEEFADHYESLTLIPSKLAPTTRLWRALSVLHGFGIHGALTSTDRKIVFPDLSEFKITVMGDSLLCMLKGLGVQYDRDTMTFYMETD